MKVVALLTPLPHMVVSPSSPSPLLRLLTGAGLAVGTQAALGLNCGAFAVCTYHALILLLYQPHSSNIHNLMELLVSILECVVVLCVAVLSWHTGGRGWQHAAFSFQVGGLMHVAHEVHVVLNGWQGGRPQAHRPPAHHHHNHNHWQSFYGGCVPCLAV